MMKRVLSGTVMITLAALTISMVSCGGGAEPRKTVTYKCLSSSCDATVVCNEGDPVPEHCGKRMIR